MNRIDPPAETDEFRAHQPHPLDTSNQGPPSLGRDEIGFAIVASIVVGAAGSAAVIKALDEPDVPTRPVVEQVLAVALTTDDSDPFSFWRLFLRGPNISDSCRHIASGGCRPGGSAANPLIL